MALEKQMELFEEGGLLQEGGSVDEESGNEVPTGSLKEEVRDDIPAQLSEGEFVMPADVVRYHGLDKMMALRDEAKFGLQRMEDMGQMGNADEAIIPDGVPFTIIDLELEDDDEPLEMQVGGFVPPSLTPGGTQQSQFAQYQPQYIPYQMPDYTQPTMPAYTPPQQAAVPMAPTSVPQFGSFVTPTYATYVNDAGNTIQIPVGPDGKPLIPVPAGFKKQTETPTTPAAEQPVTTTAPVTQPSDDGGAAPTPSAPRVDQFGREEDPRITQVKSTQPFKDIQKTVDPRGMFEKIKDDFLGAVGMSTTSEEYQKAANQLAVDVANYTADPKEQSQLLTQIKDMVGASTRTALGMPKAAIDEVDILKTVKEQRQQALPKEVGVETALVTETEGTRAAEAATKRLEATKSDIENRMNKLGLVGNQRKDFLNAVINQQKTSIDFKSGRGYPETYTGLPADVTVDFSPATSIAQAQAQTGAAQRLLDEQLDREKKTLASIQGAIPTGFRTTETAKERMERTGEGMPVSRDITRGDAARDVITAAKSQDPSQYARDVRAGKYDTEFTAMDRAREERNLQRNTGSNKVGTDIRGTYGDDVAKRVRDDQGTVSRVNTETGQISYDSSHDWSKPTQTNANRVTSTKGEETASSRSDKIVCTAMNDAYGFGAFRQTVWLQQSKNLDPAYQKGYHRIFKPLIKVAYGNTKWYNKLLRSTLEGIARRRTADIWLQKKGKRHPIGAVERAILEPICYIVGKIK
jgi:hypothetical protein